MGVSRDQVRFRAHHLRYRWPWEHCEKVAFVRRRRYIQGPGQGTRGGAMAFENTVERHVIVGCVVRGVTWRCCRRCCALGACGVSFTMYCEKGAFRLCQSS